MSTNTSTEAREKIFEDKSHNIPLYAIKSNIFKRQAIIRKLPFSKTMSTIFDEMCDYCIQEKVNSPVIDLDLFEEFYFEKKRNIKQKDFRDAVSDIINFLSDEGVQIIEILSYKDDNTPQTIKLLEEKKKNLQHFKKIKKFVSENFEMVKASKAKIFKLEELAETIGINISIVENYGIEISFNDINLDNLESYFQNREDKLFFIFVIKKGFSGKIILPLLSSIEITYSLINLIKDFYNDEKNQEFKVFVANKLEEKKLSPVKVYSVLNSMRIQDPYFLYFSQIFQIIVKNIYEKKRNQNNQISLELFNQLISAILLSQIAYNHREKIREEEKGKEEKQEHFKKVFIKALKHSQYINNQPIFFPFKYSFIDNLNLAEEEEKPLIFNSLYKKKDFIKYIETKNEKENLFKEFLLFKIKGTIYYLHRTRLISCFLTFTSSEKENIIQKLKNKYRGNHQKLFSPNYLEEYNFIVRKSISPLYSTLYYFILNSFKKTRIDLLHLKQSDINYLIDNLFFNEMEAISYEKLVPELCIKDFSKKKELLLVFLKSIFDEFGRIKKIEEIFDINPIEMREKFLDDLGVNFFVIIFYTTKEFLQNFFSFLVRKNPNEPKKKNSFLKEKYQELKNLFKKTFANNQENSKNLPLKKTNSTSTKPPDKKSLLIKKFPELNNPKNFKKKILNFLYEWNDNEDETKTQENLEKVNKLITQMVNTFSIEEIDESNIDLVYNKISENNPFLLEIPKQDSLKKYIFYKIIEIQHEKAISSTS